MDKKIKKYLLSSGFALSGCMLILCQCAFADKTNTIHSLLPDPSLTLSTTQNEHPSFISQKMNNDDTQRDRVEVKGGGLGGNKGSGKLIYDGFSLPFLTFTRDASTNTCYYYNSEVKIRRSGSGELINFPCETKDPQHPGLYWSGDFDAVNGGYSPANDALYAGTVIAQMFHKWYSMAPIHDNDNLPRPINIYLHYNADNAYWDGLDVQLGDGVYEDYPLTSLALIASMIGQDITEQYSGLSGWGQSGGIRRAFWAMTAEAVKFYAYHKNDWQLGAEISKSGAAMEYLDQPSKDCGDRKPGDWCHIDSASQYYDGLDQYYSSGVYERVFYLLATSPGWNTKKAYDIMLRANMKYWNSGTSFVSGACDVIQAAKDLGYDVNTVTKAFHGVDVDTSDCSER